MEKAKESPSTHMGTEGCSQPFPAVAGHMALYYAGFPCLGYEVGLNYLKVHYKSSIFPHAPSKIDQRGTLSFCSESISLPEWPLKVLTILLVGSD